jgi:aminomethyltransferase
MATEVTQTPPLRKTPLHSVHADLGAKFTGFGGWEMPVTYSGLSDEHLTVRNAAGIFDVSHMGEFIVSGEDALSFLQYVTSNDVSKLVPGRAHYSLLLNEKGGVVDDIIVYMLAEERYLLCVNAANSDKDLAWLQQNNSTKAVVEDVSADYAQIAVQGPKARAIVAAVFTDTDIDFSKEVFSPFTFKESKFEKSSDVIIACTGYTGEDGFEIFCSPQIAVQLWTRLSEKGESYGMKPAGLGARDTLRLEVCYPLHGHELTDEIPASSCRVGWVIKYAKGDFIGKDALEEIKKSGKSGPLLVGVEVRDRGIVRSEVPLFSGEQRVGVSTSGTQTPTLGKAVALAFVEKEFSKKGTLLEAEVRGRRLQVEIVPVPFLER